MNKAFIRDPEEPDPRCPRCGGLGESVGRTTLEAHLPAEAAHRFSETSHYCANPRCPVAYFDAAGQEAGIEQLRGPAYPKDPAGPVCSCFGISIAEIENAARSGDKKAIRELLAKTQSSEAACITRAPNGRCCVREIQRLFLKHSRKA